MKIKIGLFLILYFLLKNIVYSQDFWERTNFNYPGPVYSLFIAANGTIFAGASSYIYRSVDNGENWERVKTLSEDIISLSGTNINGYLYAGLNTYQNQYGGVYRSTDNGGNWNLVGLPGIRIDDLVVTSDGVVFAGSSTDYPNGGIYRSTDNGNSWQYCLKTYYTIKCLAVDKDDNIYAGTDDPGPSGKPTLLKSTDKGDSWFTLANWDGYSTYVRGIGINKIGDIFVYFSAKIFRSQDKGVHWEEVLTGIEHWEKVPIIFNSVGQIFIASYCGSLAGINSSNDNGNTWEQKNTGLTGTNTLSLAINKDQFLFTGTGGSIFISTQSTGPFLEPPSLISPNNNSYSNDPAPQLIWSISQNPNRASLHFVVKIANDIDFQNQLLGSPFDSQVNSVGFFPTPPVPEGVSTCSYKVQNLLYDGVYYWQVRAYNGYMYSAASSINKFGIDTTPPSGTFAKSPNISTNKLFNVSWGGGNDGNGSGLSGKYDIIVKKDNTAWTYWKTKFTNENAIYAGEHGHIYSFEALAWDNADNREDSTGMAETITFVDTTAIDSQAPLQPIGLMANDANPSPWQKNNIFKITWYTPFDPSGIAHCMYKLGDKPESNYDTTGSYSSIPIPPLLIEATQEYGQFLYAWLEDGNGNLDYRNNSSVSLRYDETPPEIKITFPKAETMISENRVPIHANIFDFNKFEYRLEYKMVVADQWEILHHDSSNESFENKQIHLWTNIRDSGNVYIRLSAWDRVDNFSSDSIRFTMDNKNYYLPTGIITQPQSNSYLSGWAMVVGYATDQNFKYYSLILRGQNVDTLLTKRYSPIEGGVLMVFDTRSIPDGKYSLFLEVVNSKEYKKLVKVPIYIDNTPPLIILNSPLSDTIGCFIPIQCNIIEDNLQRKIFKFAPSRVTNVSNFVTLDTTFTYWNTMDLNGYYSLYILAEDKAGSKSDTIMTYYINNPIYEAQNGLLKRQDEFGLHIPPNGYIPSTICLERRFMADFSYDSKKINPTDLIVQIHSSVDEKIFSKPAVLTIDYHDLDRQSYIEDKLCVFTWEVNKWNLVGGSLDKNNKTISTVIDQTGIYGLFQNNQDSIGIKKPLDFNCQPRIFSPKGGSVNNRLAISFELSKSTDVTIKIYTATGRLARILKQNETFPQGNNVVFWDGSDEWGEYCVSGLYLVTIEAGEKKATKSFMVLNE